MMFHFKCMSKRIYPLCQTRFALKSTAILSKSGEKKIVRRLFQSLFCSLFCGVLAITTASVSDAKDLGINGEVFAIEEPSLLQTIHERLHAWQENEIMDEKLKKLIESMSAHFENLPRLSSITPATVTGVRRITPRYDITRPYLGQQGEVLALPGDILLPLQHVQLTRPLLFFDATREKEWWWLEGFLKTLNKEKNPMIILIAGNVKRAMARFHDVYYDHEGRLAKRLQVTHTPTVVTQVNDALQFKEIAL